MAKRWFANFRIFETTACGTLLLTNMAPTLDRLFTPGEHLVLYESADDLVRKGHGI